MRLEGFLLPHEGMSCLAAIDFRILLRHAESLFFLAIISSLLFAVMVYLLQRRVKILHKKEWVLPFAYTFLVFALIYAVRLFMLVQHDVVLLDKRHLAARIIIAICSGLTNFLLLLTAFRLTRRALHEQVLSLLDRLHIRPIYIRTAILVLLCLASLLTATGADSGWARVPDTIISIVALFSMGFLLYQHISYRRDRWMAWIALASSIGYAIFYTLRHLGYVESIVTYFSPVVLKTDEVKAIALLLAFLIFLIFRVGLFLSAYSLMLILSAPFEGIEQFVKRVTKERKEFLENDGIIRSICEELHFKSVRLYIKLPGLTDDKIAIYAFPPPDPEHPRNPRIEEYEEGTDYDHVMKSGRTYIRTRKGYRYWFIRRIASATVPIRFHKSVVACFYTERGEGKFTEADLSILERIATMMVLTVQPYRELAAINKFNQDVSQQQIEVQEYKMERDVEGIAKIIDDIVAPLSTGISIEAGFAERTEVYPPNGDFTELTEKQLEAEIGEEDFVDTEGNRWLAMGLKIPYVSKLYKQPEQPGEQPLGKLLFVAESKKRKNVRVTVGTSQAFRLVLSDLMTNTVLDFVRGYLSQLTDNLGAELSGLEGTEFEKWHEKVQEKARQAGLLWVVAKIPDERRGPKWLGDEKARELIPALQNGQDKTKELRLYPVAEAQDGVHHVIRFCKDSEDSEDAKAMLWLGVARRGFGEELNYVSPWRFFLEHFCEIAHSSLLRIKKLIQEESDRRDREWIYSLSGATLDLDVRRHSFTHEINSLQLSLRDFIEAVSHNGLQVSGDVKKMLDILMKKCNRAKNEFESLVSTIERDKTNPCSLDTVISEACAKLEESLEELDIKLEKHNFPSRATIKVPYGIALSVMRAILDNARDALGDERRADGESEIKKIDIFLKPEPKKVICDIIDNGPGIDARVLPNLFRDIAIGPKKNSHGFGLLISKVRLRWFGGYVDVFEQQPKRKGAAFRIEFPI